MSHYDSSVLPTTCQTGMDTGRACALSVVEPLPRNVGGGVGGHGNKFLARFFPFALHVGHASLVRELAVGLGCLFWGESLNSFSRAKDVLQRARTGDGFALSFFRVEK